MTETTEVTNEVVMDSNAATVADTAPLAPMPLFESLFASLVNKIAGIGALAGQSPLLDSAREHGVTSSASGFDPSASAIFLNALTKHHNVQGGDAAWQVGAEHLEKVNGALSQLQSEAQPELLQALNLHDLANHTNPDEAVRSAITSLATNPQMLEQVTEVIFKARPEAGVSAPEAPAAMVAEPESAPTVTPLSAADFASATAVMGDHSKPAKEQEAYAALVEYVNMLLEAAGVPESQRATAAQVEDYIANAADTHWMKQHSAAHYLHLAMELKQNLQETGTHALKRQMLASALAITMNEGNPNFSITAQQASAMLPSITPAQMLDLTAVLHNPTKMYQAALSSPVEVKQECQHKAAEKSDISGKMQKAAEEGKLLEPKGEGVKIDPAKFKRLLPVGGHAAAIEAEPASTFAVVP